MENNDSLKLALYFSCCNLKDEDQLTKSDPIVKVYKIQNNSTVFIGKTEVIENDLNPFFKTKVDVLYESQLKQYLKIVVFDHDTDTETDHLGLFLFPYYLFRPLLISIYIFFLAKIKCFFI